MGQTSTKTKTNSESLEEKINALQEKINGLQEEINEVQDSNKELQKMIFELEEKRDKLICEIFSTKGIYENVSPNFKTK